MRVRSSHDIVGRKVLTQDGREVGNVEALEIDVDSWAVESLELRLRRDALEVLHIKRPMFGSRTVKLDVDRVSGVTDAVVLRASVEELGEVLAETQLEET